MMCLACHGWPHAYDEEVNESAYHGRQVDCVDGQVLTIITAMHTRMCIWDIVPCVNGLHGAGAPTTTSSSAWMYTIV